jgi:polyhydroxyalkanoate synthesis regulator phasin
VVVQDLVAEPGLAEEAVVQDLVGELGAEQAAAVVQDLVAGPGAAEEAAVQAKRPRPESG